MADTKDELGTCCSARKQRRAQRVMGVKGHEKTAKPGTNGNIKVSNESNSLIKTHWKKRDQKFLLILIN